MSVFDLSTLTEPQLGWVREAIAECDFPMELLLPGLGREGKTTISVQQADLSRYARAGGDGSHEHGVHPIEREVDGRRAVWGLYYLPPHTKIVLERTLNREQTKEVFGAELAHAVDYCYMTPDMRRAFVNAVHTQQLPADASVADGASFTLDGHTCSWFDVNTYAWWVGEAFMEGFVEAYMPKVVVTIQLRHPVGAEDRDVIRRALTPELDAVQSVFATKNGRSYHDVHGRIKKDRVFATRADAVGEGLSPCRVCKPGTAERDRDVVLPEQAAVVNWLDAPGPTPQADEVARRFREVGVLSNAHAQRVMEQVRARRGRAAWEDTPARGPRPTSG